MPLHHMTLELCELLSKADVEGPFILVGHSYGGWMAQLLASRQPDLVAGLVLVDTPHPREWVEPDNAQRARVVRGARTARLAAFGARFGVMRAFLQLGRFRSSSEHNRVALLLGKTSMRSMAAEFDLLRPGTQAVREGRNSLISRQHEF